MHACILIKCVTDKARKSVLSSAAICKYRKVGVG